MNVNEVALAYQAVPFGLEGKAYLRKLCRGRSFYLHGPKGQLAMLHHDAADLADLMESWARHGRADHYALVEGEVWVEEKPAIQAGERVFANIYTALTTRRTDDSAQQGCYPGCFYYTDSCYRQPCRKYN